MDFERNWFYWRKFTLFVEVFISYINLAEGEIE